MNQGASVNLSWYDIHRVRLSIREKVDVELHRCLSNPMFNVWEHEKVSRLGLRGEADV